MSLSSHSFVVTPAAQASPFRLEVDLVEPTGAAAAAAAVPPAKPGDPVEPKIDGIGVLRNRIAMPQGSAT